MSLRCTSTEHRRGTGGQGGRGGSARFIVCGSWFPEVIRRGVVPRVAQPCGQRHPVLVENVGGQLRPIAGHGRSIGRRRGSEHAWALGCPRLDPCRPRLHASAQPAKTTRWFVRACSAKCNKARMWKDHLCWRSCSASSTTAASSSPLKCSKSARPFEALLELAPHSAALLLPLLSDASDSADAGRCPESRGVMGNV